MPAALLTVLAPILHPIAARAGDVLAWYPARDIAVLRLKGPRWVVVRALGFDNAGALAVLLADDAIIPYGPADATVLRLQLPPSRMPRQLAEDQA